MSVLHPDGQWDMKFYESDFVYITPINRLKKLGIKLTRNHAGAKRRQHVAVLIIREPDSLLKTGLRIIWWLAVMLLFIYIRPQRDYRRPREGLEE